MKERTVKRKEEESCAKAQLAARYNSPRLPIALPPVAEDLDIGRCNKPPPYLNDVKTE